MESNLTQTYHSLDYWIHQIGFTRFSDTLNFIFIPMLCAFGVFFNIISLIILFQNEFKSIRLFEYLKEYLVVSIFICFISIGLVLLGNSYLNLDLYISYFFFIYIYLTIVNTAYFYSCMLDIIIGLEYVYILTNKPMPLRKYSTSLVCSVLLVVCTAINAPFYFNFQPVSFLVNLNQNETVLLYYLDYTQFAKSIKGKIILYTLFVFRDILTIIGEITINVFAIVLFKNHLCKKSTLLKSSVKVLQLIKTKATQLNTSAAASNTSNISNLDLMTTLTVIVMSTLSILEHFFILMGLIYANFELNSTTYAISSIANCFIALKHSTNFFVFMSIHKNFKNGFKNLLKKKKNRKN
jgi:hypothetical protein